MLFNFGFEKRFFAHFRNHNSKMQVRYNYKSGGICGCDFLQGAAQGLIVYFANHLAHAKSDNDVVLPVEGEIPKQGQYYPDAKKIDNFLLTLDFIKWDIFNYYLNNPPPTVILQKNFDKKT